LIEERTFNNRYRLDGKLGEGGMATVYGGTDTVLRRRVAIKVLREQYAADQEFVRRFYQEAESAAKLSHPNIVNTYDVGREGDTYYIVMELVDGPSLAEIIAADGKLPEPVAIDYAAQIASGLAYAHRAGLLHRDIKPANILVTKDDVVKLSDFGIARAVSTQTMTLTKPGLVMGSVYYISPEQAQGHELHEASDLYSLGIVLYQMLTGQMPFSGESPVTVALKHISDPVPRIDTRTLGVSPALAAIVNKLLQKNPQNRFQSASELASALREARERPSHAAYRIADDAPKVPRASDGRRLPPRRSPLPDRSQEESEEEEDRPARSGVWLVLALVVLLVGATATGYFMFGHSSLIPSFGTGITVADYTNMTDAMAQQDVVNSGLTARMIKTASDTVAANHVIRQYPLPGSKADKNAVVELYVSNGKPLVGLLDVRGFPALAAERALASQNFVVKLVRKFDASAKDNVIDQVPKPQSQIRQGSIVTLTVSDGPEPIVVPNFVGMQTAAAQALAAKLGVTLDTSQTLEGMPADTVASQDVSYGSRIDKATVIHATVNSGIPANGQTSGPGPGPGAGTIAVPSVTGSALASARSSLVAAGLTVRVEYATQSSNNGRIVAQSPDGNVAVAPGSSVTITLSVSGEVPDTGGMMPDGATATLEAYGYSVSKIEYTNAVGTGGKVVGTDPEVGTDLSPGSGVTLIVNGKH
jgi:eukaryotic-like serine/threonine-protein kinase